MADLKISQLSAATALAGTEVVPVVQSALTKKATIAQILTPAAGNGIDYSANTPNAGMTSQLLNIYEAGTWTPQLRIGGVAATQTSNGLYTRVGRIVNITASIENINKGVLTGGLTVTGIPFAAGTLTGGRFVGSVSVSRVGLATNGVTLVVYLNTGGTEAILSWNLSTNANSTAADDTQILSTSTDIYFTLTYSV